MYSISKRTVLLMDFHYSMLLLSVYDMLLHLIIYKYWKTPIKNRMDMSPL